MKQQSAGANVAALQSDLARLRAVAERFTPAVSGACQAYNTEKNAKAATQTALTAAREALDQYRVNVFPAYETAINTYLQRFGAGFRLGSVTSVNTRGGSSCNYSVVINNTPVSVTAGVAGAPSFRSTLSAGDRNALALAFFFVSLDRDPALAQKVVVIDDPMTSLDEHRSLTTVQEVYYLLHMERDTYDYPELRITLDALVKKYHPSQIFIEETAAGLVLKKDDNLQSRFLIALKPIEQDRKGRLYGQQGKFQDGLVRFPKDAPFMSKIEEELLSYPHGNTDDIVDSIALALQHGGTGYDATLSWV